jgi:hypothetical protein
MSDDIRVLRCLVKGAKTATKISLSVDNDVDDLKEMVYNENKNRVLRDADIPDMHVWKVRTLRLEWMFLLTTWQLKKQATLAPEATLGNRIFS